MRTPTLFCDCNSRWEFQGGNYEILWHTQLIGSDIRGRLSIPCPDCFANKWYNADYENMMFDLQRMNQ